MKEIDGNFTLDSDRRDDEDNFSSSDDDSSYEDDGDSVDMNVGSEDSAGECEEMDIDDDSVESTDIPQADVSREAERAKVVNVHFSELRMHAGQTDRVIYFEVDDLTEPITISCPVPKYYANNENQESLKSSIGDIIEAHRNSILVNGNQKEALAAVKESLCSINNILPTSNGRGYRRGGGNDDPSGPQNNNDTEMDFKKIGGLESQIRYLERSIIHPFVKPSQYSPPKGVLFFGPPGTGKTITALALATELEKRLQRKVNFYYRKGPDCFNPYVGESEKILQQLFEDANNSKPSIIFLDEIDGLCPSRDRKVHNTIVTTLLGLMDKLIPGNVVVIGATNRVDSLDAAMIRPGRFDKHLVFNPPDEQGRLKILKINLEKWDADERPSEHFLKTVAVKTSGFSGADLEKLCRDAFLCAFDRHIPDIRSDSTITGLTVTPKDWETALIAMNHTDSNSFGSFLYVPKKPPEISAMLLECQTAEVMKMLRLLTPAKPSKRGFSANNSLAFYSFYIHDIHDKRSRKCTPSANIFISHILSSTEFSGYTMYLISLETISTKHNHLEAIRQAENSSSPCILLITDLDEICSRYRTESKKIANQLNRGLRGKDVLLLASGSCESCKLTIPEFSVLFTGCNRSYDIKFSNEAERAKLFCTLFVSGHEKCPKLNVSRLRERCMLVTANSSIMSLINLHEDLRRTINSFAGGMNLNLMLMEILERFHHQPSQ